MQVTQTSIRLETNTPLMEHQTKSIINNGYSQSKIDYSLFTKQRGDKWVYLVIYVNDHQFKLNTY